jgi:hypothetical protein
MGKKTNPRWRCSEDEKREWAFLFYFGMKNEFDFIRFIFVSYY